MQAQKERLVLAKHKSGYVFPVYYSLRVHHDVSYGL